MKTVISSWLLFRLLFRPTEAFEELSETRPEPHAVFFKYVLWLAIIPPVFAYIGASNFGWRIGAAEGLSWIEEVTYIENENMESKGYRPSQLMNYLDFTLDVNLGDLFRSSSLENAWLGFSIHHRSSIFESASQFGRIKGGSNYPSLYIQWDLP